MIDGSLSGRSSFSGREHGDSRVSTEVSSAKQGRSSVVQGRGGLPSQVTEVPLGILVEGVLGLGRGRLLGHWQNCEASSALGRGSLLSLRSRLTARPLAEGASRLLGQGDLLTLGGGVLGDSEARWVGSPSPLEPESSFSLLGLRRVDLSIWLV